MTAEVFIRRTRIEAPAGEVFRWHSTPGALERLTPPWEPVKLVERTGGIEDGARVVLRMHMGPLSRRWVAEHRDYREGSSFRDVQIEGPFARWEHTHTFEPDGDDACTLEDRIEYELPLGAPGRLVGGPTVRKRLNRLFSHRHLVTQQDIAAHTQREVRPMKILISGSTGLVGSALIPFLTTGGHEVVRLVRSQPREIGSEFRWDPDAGQLDPAAFDGVDAVVHLAGENISGRWTAAKKARILESRVKGTRTVAEALAGLDEPPKVLVSSSAVGYYGDRGDEVLTEESSSGSLFLSEVCRQWEAATEPVATKGIRVVNLRTAPVLTPAGGPLAQLLTPFRLGLGGVVGSGRQYFPWIAIDDLIGAIHHALITESLSGPVNAAAPQQVTNHELTKTLGRVLGRPTLFPLPAFAARLAFGEVADELLLASQRVEPVRLMASGYSFRLPDLEGALAHLLGK
jgi:uncharacterized protein (TIGR01777 family)